MALLNWFMLASLCAFIYRQYRKSGVLLTPSAAWVFSNVIAPVYLAYPIAGSPEAASAIGWKYASSLAWGVDEVVLIVTVGTVSLILAYKASPSLFARWVRMFAKHNPPARPAMNTLVLGACVSSLLALAFIWVFFFNAGEIPLLSADPTGARIRLAHMPGGLFYEGAYTVTNVATIFLLGAFSLGKVRAYRMLFLVAVTAAVLSNLLTASRGNLLGPFVITGLIFFSAKEKSKSLTVIRALSIAAGVLLLAAVLEFVRGRMELSWGGIEDQILYGNTFFANLRDSGRVVSLFEMGRYDWFYGKTILAGLLGFMPRTFWLKEQYRWGTVTLRMAGASDPEAVFGMAHVVFADWYVNFGYFGPILEGLILGFVLRLLDERLFDLRSRARNLAGYDYYGAFKVWFLWVVSGMLLSSAMAPFAYPYLAGFAAIFCLAKMTGKIFLLTGRREADQLNEGSMFKSVQRSFKRG